MCPRFSKSVEVYNTIFRPPQSHDRCPDRDGPTKFGAMETVIPGS